MVGAAVVVVVAVVTARGGASGNRGGGGDGNWHPRGECPTGLVATARRHSGGSTESRRRRSMGDRSCSGDDAVIDEADRSSDVGAAAVTDRGTGGDGARAGIVGASPRVNGHRVVGRGPGIIPRGGHCRRRAGASAVSMMPRWAARPESAGSGWGRCMPGMHRQRGDERRQQAVRSAVVTFVARCAARTRGDAWRSQHHGGSGEGEHTEGVWLGAQPPGPRHRV